MSLDNNIRSREISRFNFLFALKLLKRHFKFFREILLDTIVNLSENHNIIAAVDWEMVLGIVR